MSPLSTSRDKEGARRLGLGQNGDERDASPLLLSSLTEENNLLKSELAVVRAELARYQEMCSTTSYGSTSMGSTPNSHASLQYQSFPYNNSKDHLVPASPASLESTLLLPPSKRDKRRANTYSDDDMESVTTASASSTIGSGLKHRKNNLPHQHYTPIPDHAPSGLAVSAPDHKRPAVPQRHHSTSNIARRLAPSSLSTVAVVTTPPRVGAGLGINTMMPCRKDSDKVSSDDDDADLERATSVMTAIALTTPSKVKAYTHSPSPRTPDTVAAMSFSCSPSPGSVATTDTSRRLRFNDDTATATITMPTSLCVALQDRAGWLVGLLVLQSLSSFIISRNESLLQQHLVIVRFLTMLVGAGGNAGNQASVGVIRGLATGMVHSDNVHETIYREVCMAVGLSTILGVAGALRAALFSTPATETLAITVCLISIVFISVLLGTILPLLMKVLRIDPAHSSTSIQVIMDILGVLITVRTWNLRQ